MQIKLNEDITPSKLIKIRSYLGLNMTEMSETMGAPYYTYVEWEGSRRTNSMTPSTKQFLRLLVDVKGTEIGKRFGI